MATGWPMKVSYANGDVYSASDVNDTNGTINLLGSSVAYTAGKNKIINGDFAINQRAFTSTTTTNVYGFDRFALNTSDGTSTYSAQTFTPGTAPVAGYESTNFARLVSTGQTLNTALSGIYQKIEDVRTFAGNTVTMSFWAKASTGTPSVAASAWQEFGTGGSAATQQGSKVQITSSWARYSVNIVIPSLSGKTIGTTSFLRMWLITSAGSTRDAYTGSLGIQSVTIDFWGVQVESGSTATAFQTATATIQGELAACQRYYWRAGGSNLYQRVATGANSATNAGYGIALHPVTMRIAPTVLEFSTLGLYEYGGSAAISSLAINQSGTTATDFSYSTSGMTQYRPVMINTQNSLSGYLGFSAEL